MRGVVEASHCHTLELKAAVSKDRVTGESRNRLVAIRAIQGHTIDLDDGDVFGEANRVTKDNVKDFACCIHCTAEVALDGIMSSGLQSEKRLLLPKRCVDTFSSPLTTTRTPAVLVRVAGNQRLPFMLTLSN